MHGLMCLVNQFIAWEYLLLYKLIVRVYKYSNIFLFQMAGARCPIFNLVIHNELLLVVYLFAFILFGLHFLYLFDLSDLQADAKSHIIIINAGVLQ